MKPAKQGHFDGACGLYSIGNALSLLSKRTKTDEIFYTLFNFFCKKYGNAEIILFEGISRNQLNDILTNTIKILQLDLKIYRPFWNNSAKSISDFHKILADEVNENQSAAIIGYEYSKFNDGDYCSHWTVIKKTTEKSLFTYDSHNENKIISIKKCRIWDDFQKHKIKPYKISSTDTFIIYK
ncbi:hypothetical protein H4684_003192 [Desulfomicrobium macestii]|uniref:Peptidase C39-like domain-containing protein n=1 Tax=Desulfomicrobium macestii TaxID=90731 RepID=A0ABR9H746_9BACT|nr:hypothetical protein [Desulfomicrobium macestii]MBE1426526.1 hypothetical protein [Desulfomicrobium macestii]